MKARSVMAVVAILVLASPVAQASSNRAKGTGEASTAPMPTCKVTASGKLGSHSKSCIYVPSTAPMEQCELGEGGELRNRDKPCVFKKP